MNSMPNSQIDAVFANYTDNVICNAWDAALAAQIAINGEHIIDSWPDTWRIVWSVNTHLGLWDGDGIGALWLCDQEFLNLFTESLSIIGESYASSYLSRSLDAVGRVNLRQERFVMSDDFSRATKEWNEESRFCTMTIMTSLAAYARPRRNESAPLFDEIRNHITGVPSQE